MDKRPKKWNERDIDIIYNNLLREYGHSEVHSMLNYYLGFVTNNMCDAKNLVYYALKRKHSKIIMDNYGKFKAIEYEPKPNVPLYYANLTNQQTPTYQCSSTAYQYYDGASYYQLL